jgi:protein involved in polysaccharide export with SLBB domain
MLFCTVIWSMLFMAGCKDPDYIDPTKFGVNGGQNETGKGAFLRIGDQIMITYSGTVGTDTLLHDHAETIKEDGTISPALISPVVAAGKTAGVLQQELQTNYDKLYNNLTVTVVVQGRYYYVSGEVRKPGPEPYLGETDIVKAISAAGYFTDFANKKKVKVTRANGRTETIDVQKIIDEPQSYTCPIYPGDSIVVKRSLF